MFLDASKMVNLMADTESFLNLRCFQGSLPPARARISGVGAFALIRMHRFGVETRWNESICLMGVSAALPQLNCLAVA